MRTGCLSDLFLDVWPIIFTLDLSRYILAAGTLAATLAVFARPLARRRIQPGLPDGKDIRREIGFSFSTVILFSLVGFAVYLGSQYGVFRIYGGTVPSATRILLEFTAMVVLHDAFFYWAHRAMHTRLLFRRFHRLHHRSRTPTPWAAYSFAPPEALLEASFLPIVALFLPAHEITVFFFVTHMILRNVVGHAGVELFPSWWLRAPVLRWITTTTHHDLHHSHGRYNFGLYFTWWDRWMQTEHPEYASRFMSVAGAACRLPANAKENSNDR